MKDFKTLLFSETYYYYKRWKELKEQNGEYARGTDITYTRYATLYNLIIEAELENEYLEWRDKQQ